MQINVSNLEVYCDLYLEVERTDQNDIQVRQQDFKPGSVRPSAVQRYVHSLLFPKM